MKPTIINNPPKSWWSGDDRVEKFMPPVRDAIMRHLPWPSAEYTDIYNRAYEAVYKAIMEYADKEKPVNTIAEPIRSKKPRKRKK
jgi:hypothetical protein